MLVVKEVGVGIAGALAVGIAAIVFKRSAVAVACEDAGAQAAPSRRIRLNAKNNLHPLIGIIDGSLSLLLIMDELRLLGDVIKDFFTLSTTETFHFYLLR